MLKTIFAVTALLVVAFLRMRSEASLRLIRQADQDITSSWIPLKVGEGWAYNVEWKSGDRQQPAVQNWTTEEVVSKLVRVPEGLVVVKDVTTHGRSSGAFADGWSASSFLVHNNCLYFLVGRSDWDDTRQRIGVRFKQELNGGISQPDLCFPMETGRQWGGLDTIWQVVGFGPSEFSDPVYPESFHITGRLGSGGATDVWLAKGVGIVGVRYLHQGTCDEYVKKLWAFQRN